MRDEFDETLRRLMRPGPLAPTDQSVVDLLRTSLAAAHSRQPGAGPQTRLLQIATAAAAVLVLVGFALVNLRLMAGRNSGTGVPPHTAPASSARVEPSRSPTAGCPVDYLGPSVKGWQMECSFQFGIQLSYPPGSPPAPDGKPYSLSLASGSSPQGVPLPVTDICEGSLFAGHVLRPYGSKPVVLPVTVSGEEGCFVLPSPDQPTSMHGNGVVVFKLPTAEGAYAFGYVGFEAKLLPAVAATIRFFGPAAGGIMEPRQIPAGSDQPPPAAVRCHTAALSAQIVFSGSAMNQGRVEIELTNVGQQPCQMYGWPGVQMTDAQGRALPTKNSPTTGLYVEQGPEPPVLVTLAAGGSAYFGIGPLSAAVSPDANTCEHPSQLLITPPDETTSLRMPTNSSRGGFASACGGGRLDVLPVQPITPFITT